MTEPSQTKPEFTEHRVADCYCPFCDWKLDGASGGPEPPHPGDVSLCIRCAQALIFNDDMSVRAMTPKEFKELDPELKADLDKYMKAVRSVDRTKW